MLSILVPSASRIANSEYVIVNMTDLYLSVLSRPCRTPLPVQRTCTRRKGQRRKRENKEKAKLN